jgi:hypothetical protein
MSRDFAHAYADCVLELSYSSPAAVPMPPGSEGLRKAVRVLGPTLASSILVLVQAPPIGEIWFMIANLLLIGLVTRRMPRMLNRALAARPPVA